MVHRLWMSLCDTGMLEALALQTYSFQLSKGRVQELRLQSFLLDLLKGARQSAGGLVLASCRIPNHQCTKLPNG